MNRLNELIQELCPNGVKHVQLSTVCDVLRGERLIKAQLSDDGKYPVLHGGLTPMGYYSDFNRKAGTTIVVNTGNAGSVFYSDKEFWSSDACFSLYPHNGLSDRYLFHFVLQNEPTLKGKIRTGAMPTIDVLAVETLRIPLPPLPVQQEIVRILDNFTELTAELAARRKQYEHYRDELLTTPADSTMMALGAIADYRRGSFPQPYGNSEWYGGVGAMPFVQVADVEENGMVLREQTKQQISVVAQPKSVYVPAGTVICSIQGSIGKVAITQYDAYVDRTLAIFEKYKTDINKRYFAYQIQRKFGIEKEFARGSTLKTITKEEFTKFEIPVPPITEQERIVSVLDRFDTLCNDLTSGLPAEIAARQKQYEYYRDKLLTFKELEG